MTPSPELGVDDMAMPRNGDMGTQPQWLDTQSNVIFVAERCFSVCVQRREKW